ncbi:MAG: hypothetical protein P0120_13950 [Nitrospira sp.]|nr:hypothetical protein [Nitrospira sp.]
MAESQISEIRTLRTGLTDAVEFVEESVALFTLSSTAAHFVVQMPLAGNIGILELLNPAIELPGDAEAARSQITNFRFQRGEAWNAFHETQHGTDFAGRSSGDVKKGKEFVRAAALEAFGDVVRNGQCGSLQLVP